jgi:hypothetical protein
MSASIIDLCEDLHPADLLDDIEETLADRALEVVSLCKGIWQDGKWELLEEAGQAAEELWRRHGEQIGRAAALLWLADLYWRNARSDGAIRYAVKAIDHVPDEPPPVYSTVKAVANYLLSLSHESSHNLSMTFSSCQKTAELLQITQGYWQRAGDNAQEIACGKILNWTKRLIKYTNYQRLNPPSETLMTLICPWRASVKVKENYVLAELQLERPLTSHDMDPAQAGFVSRRGRAWRKVRDNQQIGYTIGQKLQVLGIDDTIKTFTLRALNTKLQIGAAPLLPAGATYYLLPVEEQLASPDMDIQLTDYFLVCGSAPREDCDDLIGLSQHQESSAMVLGAFQRDPQGRVYEKAFQPARFVGEPEANFIPLGSVDFILRPV